MSAPPPPPPPPATFELVQVATGFSTPLDIQQPDDASGRLFVIEQGGHIQIIQSNGTRAATPFLDVTGRAGFTSGGETGLLGLAFHPNYKNNRRFFVNYTRNNATQLQTVIAEFTASSTNSNFADPTTENILSPSISRFAITTAEDSRSARMVSCISASAMAAVAATLLATGKIRIRYSAKCCVSTLTLLMLPG